MQIDVLYLILHVEKDKFLSVILTTIKGYFKMREIRQALIERNQSYFYAYATLLLFMFNYI